MPTRNQFGSDDEFRVALRDYFAIHADMSRLERSDTNVGAQIVGRYMPLPVDGTINQMKWQLDLSARLRYMSADAMIAAREVTP